MWAFLSGPRASPQVPGRQGVDGERRVRGPTAAVADPPRDRRAAQGLFHDHARRQAGRAAAVRGRAAPGPTRSPGALYAEPRRVRPASCQCGRSNTAAWDCACPARLSRVLWHACYSSPGCVVSAAAPLTRARACAAGLTSRRCAGCSSGTTAPCTSCASAASGAPPRGRVAPRLPAGGRPCAAVCRCLG